MRERDRKSIEIDKMLPQFTTMNVIEGQAGLVNYSSLIFYSLTLNNILNIIGEEAFTSSFDKIYCGASEKPEGWTSNWYQSYGGKFADIQWGVTR